MPRPVAGRSSLEGSWLPTFGFDGGSGGGTTPSVPAVYGGVDATAGSTSYAMPAAVTIGQEVIVQKIDTSANTVVAHPDGSDTINGVNADSDPIATQWDSIRLYCVAVGAWTTVI